MYVGMKIIMKTATIFVDVCGSAFFFFFFVSVFSRFPSAVASFEICCNTLTSYRFYFVIHVAARSFNDAGVAFECGNAAQANWTATGSACNGSTALETTLFVNVSNSSCTLKFRSFGFSLAPNVVVRSINVVLARYVRRVKHPAPITHHTHAFSLTLCLLLLFPLYRL
jgi:hypothetical protein